MKKFLTLLCAAALTLALLAIPAAAAAREDAMEISVESLTCNPGETVKTAILLAHNPGLASVKLLVEYDSGALRYEGAALCGGFAAAKGASLAQEVTRGGKHYVALSWVCTEGEVTDERFAELSFRAAQKPTGAETALTLHAEAENLFDAALRETDFRSRGGTIRFASSAVYVETEETAEGLRFHLENGTLRGEQQLRIAIAFRDEDGRQRGLVLAPAAAAQDLKTLDILCPGRKTGEAWRLFVLDAETLAPLCGAIDGA